METQNTTQSSLRGVSCVYMLAGIKILNFLNTFRPTGNRFTAEFQLCLMSTILFTQKYKCIIPFNTNLSQCTTIQGMQCSVYQILIPDHRTKTICIPGNVQLPYLNCGYAKFPMTCYCKSNNLSDLLNQIRPNLSQRIHNFHSNFKFIGQHIFWGRNLSQIIFLAALFYVSNVAINHYLRVNGKNQFNLTKFSMT